MVYHLDSNVNSLTKLSMVPLVGCFKFYLLILKKHMPPLPSKPCSVFHCSQNQMPRRGLWMLCLHGHSLPSSWSPAPPGPALGPACQHLRHLKDKPFWPTKLCICFLFQFSDLKSSSPRRPSGQIFLMLFASPRFLCFHVFHLSTQEIIFVIYFCVNCPFCPRSTVDPETTQELKVLTSHAVKNLCSITLTPQTITSNVAHCGPEALQMAQSINTYSVCYMDDVPYSYITGSQRTQKMVLRKS